MKGLEKHTRKMAGYGSAMPDPNPMASEGTCTLCGRFMPLNKRGRCDTEECIEKAHAEVRRRAGDRKIVEGLYYNLDGIEIMMFEQLTQWKEPVPPEEYSPDFGVETDRCEMVQCRRHHRPNDTLCVAHRLETNRATYRNEGKQYKRVEVKPKKLKRLGNRIKGLAGIKLK